MDVRGVEVTNQLRSAIRAKLLEMGVQYDEELPDYILVMVVNKKTRQQMHEDLHLFLEATTTPFVDWLHDEVLKKLQKVTVTKRKTPREFVPTVVVKQEEEKKKRKVSGLPEDLKVKEEPLPQQLLNKPTANKVKASPASIQHVEDKSDISEHSSPKISTLSVDSRTIKPIAKDTPPKSLEKVDKPIESSNKIILNSKRTPEPPGRPEKKTKTVEQPDLPREEPDASDKRLKSSVNKPKITSVVSVKTRLGITSPRNKFEVHRDRLGNDNRRQSEKRVDRRLYEPVNRRDFRGRNIDEEISKKCKEEVKNRPISAMISNKRTILNTESNDKSVTSKSRVETISGTIKDRLGLGNKSKQKEVSEDTVRSVKNRLGPAKSKFLALGRLGPTKSTGATAVNNNLFDKKRVELDDEDEGPTGPVKSHIIAVKNLMTEKRVKRLNTEKEDIDNSGKSLASKVIVTPRPLKPLQPDHKNATRTLLLRAVDEANQSVAKQKNPEPALLEKKAALKRLRPSNIRPPGKNLAVHLNANKRLVMEKIQVELTTSDAVENNEPEPYVPRAVTEEQMGVVMSLFQRGNDNQKFLVTLNGYNSNGTKDKTFSDDEERLVMEVTEDDEMLLSNPHTEPFVSNESSPELEDEEEEVEEEEEEEEEIVEEEEEEFENLDKRENLENNENHHSDNFEGDEMPKKRRKLSPIVYNRSRSPSPDGQKDILVSSIINKKIPSLIASDKIRDKCRYWPNCTLGNKCAFFHPPVPCSAFPACKFGDKCAYKHPNCKFGLSCTKLGCIFSHPSQQCKYHPFCTKPGCPYLHPQTQLATTETVRAKFTWRRRD